MTHKRDTNSKIYNFRLDTKSLLGKKVLTDHTQYIYLTWDARVTIIQDNWYWRFQTEVEVIVAYRCSKFDLYWLLSCRDNSKLNFFLCWATVTWHQGQGLQNDHEYISHAYLHAKFEYHSLTILQDITITVQVKAFVNFETQLLPWVKVKVIRLRTDYRDL